MKLDTCAVRKLAVAASVDPRTIEKVAAGRPVRGLPGYRARRVLEAEGILSPANCLDPVERRGAPGTDPETRT